MGPVVIGSRPQAQHWRTLGTAGTLAVLIASVAAPFALTQFAKAQTTPEAPVTDTTAPAPVSGPAETGGPAVSPGAPPDTTAAQPALVPGKTETVPPTTQADAPPSEKKPDAVSKSANTPQPPAGKGSGGAAKQASAPVQCREILGAAQAKLSSDLVIALAERPGSGTAIVSPASLAFTLATLEHGASEDMKKGIRQTLGFASGAAGGDPLDCLRKSTAESVKAGGTLLQRADRLMFSQLELPKGPKLLAALKADGIELKRENLAKPDGIEKVNAWAKEKTAGAIPSILTQPITAPGLVALNALHFKAPWQTNFDKALTADAPFLLTGGGTTSVRMMTLPVGTYQFGTQGRFTAVELPFGGGPFTMIVVTTNDEPAAAAAFRDVASWLEGSALEYREGEVLMPQISVEDGGDLIATLDRLGLAAGRTSANALKGFGDGIALGSVLQRVRLQADEDGATASAVTAGIATRSIDRVKMVVNKPFLFAVRDTETGLILVAGYVSQPSLQGCASGGGQSCAKPNTQ